MNAVAARTNLLGLPRPELEAFAAAVEVGAPFPTTAVDAIRTMELIDATYVAAGLPTRQPTPVTTSDTGAESDAKSD